MISDRNTKPEILAAYQALLKTAGSRKIPIPPDIASVNARSTKGELLSAHDKLERLLKRNPVRDADDKDGQMSLALEEGDSGKVTVKKAVPIENDGEKSGVRIKDMPSEKTALSGQGFAKKDYISLKEDEELKLLNDEIINKIQSLNEAKALRLKENEMLSTLEGELERFIIMLNKSREKLFSEKQAFEERRRDIEEKCREEALNAELEAAERIEEAEKRLSDAEAKLEETIKRRDAERASEKEQYDYDLSVLFKREDDAFADESLKREAGIAALEDEIKELENMLSEREALVPEYKERLEKLPDILEKAREEGADSKEKELVTEFSHKDAIAKKDAEASAKTLERQIEALREDFEALLTEKNAIQEKLDRAYDESNKLYLQTIQSTGGIKILGGLDKK